MGRKSKAIAVSENKEIDKKQRDELIEMCFIKLMGETKTKRYKICMKYITEKLNSAESLEKGIRSLLMALFIEICSLEKERDEALLKLREYEKSQT